MNTNAALQPHKVHMQEAQAKLGPLIGNWTILHTYRGSIAHGMYVPSTNPLSIDDIDTMAIIVAPVQCYLGLQTFGSDGTKEIMQLPWDIVVYELRKFVRLLQQGNPNVLSMLWCDKEHIIHADSMGLQLRAARNLFVGKHVYNSFIGYAHSQLKRMMNGAYRGYMGEKRKAMVEMFGYDTKNAAHLIRLMRMCVEFLRDGQLKVVRPDAKELLAIKLGGFTLVQVQAMADDLFREAQDAKANSDLPEAPDYDGIELLLVSLIKERFGWG